MKKILSLPLLLLLIFTSCNNADETDPVPDGVARVVINVKKQVLENGKITTQPANSLIHLWKAEGREFDVAASGEDIHVGYAFDKTSGKKVNSDYGSLGAAINEDVTPGRYFAYVVLQKSSSAGSQAYSYTYFEVKAGERAFMNKIFSHDVASNSFEAWTKNR